MTRIRTLATVAFAAIALAFATLAAAQMPYSQGAGPGPGMSRPGGPPDPAFVRQNLQSLHDRLEIRGDQETAWRSFASTVERQTQDMQSMRGRMAAAQGATAPERLKSMAQLMQQSAAGVANVAAALSSLYAVLDSRQREIVDREFAPPQGPGGPPPQ